MPTLRRSPVAPGRPSDPTCCHPSERSATGSLGRRVLLEVLPSIMPYRSSLSYPCQGRFPLTRLVPGLGDFGGGPRRRRRRGVKAAAEVSQVSAASPGENPAASRRRMLRPCCAAAPPIASDFTTATSAQCSGAAQHGAAPSPASAGITARACVVTVSRLATHLFVILRRDCDPLVLGPADRALFLAVNVCACRHLPPIGTGRFR
jgi:hypothetical protein